MYLALYRKYRPRKFLDVVGQNHIVKTLRNQIVFNHISHAYLFCGIRGTGKTSIAKIFATAINCEQNQNGEPCLNCKSCINVLNRQDPNIIEIDAASNNGVDNIREIRDEVKYPPVNSKYKIYIIDEVHMLSQGAFNALLKTLEEPPKHVIFILATTDPQKIPATILSRCQRFDFKRISMSEMFTAIKKYMSQEKINISDDALEYIIKISDGAMRDALSILDQCLSLCLDEQKIDLKKVLEIIGTVDNDICRDFLLYLYKKDTENILDLIAQIIKDGKDINQFLNTFIVFLRDLIIFKSTNHTENKSEQINNIFSQLYFLSLDEIIGFIEKFSSLQNELRYSVNPRILFEISCLKFCYDFDEDDTKTPQKICDKQENIDNKQQKEVSQQKIIKEKILPEDINKIINSWPDIINKFDGLTKEILKLSCVGYLENNIVYIVTKDSSSSGILKQKKSEIKDIILKDFSFDFDIAFISQYDYDLKHKKIYGQEDRSLVEQLKKINMKINIDE